MDHKAPEEDQEDEESSSADEGFYDKLTKILPIDPILALPLIIFIVHIRLWSFLLVVAAFGFVGILKLRGTSTREFIEKLMSKQKK